LVDLPLHLRQPANLDVGISQPKKTSTKPGPLCRTFLLTTTLTPHQQTHFLHSLILTARLIMTSFQQSKTAVPVAFGAMTIGEKGKEQSRVHDQETVQAILDVLKKHGVEEIDVRTEYRWPSLEVY
jgi:hypothetical protein